VGPGQSYLILNRSIQLAQRLAPDVEAVWSIIGAYIVETGIFGFLCLAIIGRKVIGSIWISADRTLGIACAMVWFIGITFSTSYHEQPALWFFLAVLIGWKANFGVRRLTELVDVPAGALRAQ
jgi:hypothetical protein